MIPSGLSLSSKSNHHPLSPSLSLYRMGFNICNALGPLIIFSLLCLQSRVWAENSGSVLFLDSPTHQFIRTRSSNDVAKTGVMLLPEVGAAVSVLLGFAPPATLSAASSSKLNEVLMPNPFNRPRAVFTLEVIGAEDSQFRVDIDNANFGSVFRSKIIIDSNKANIHLPDEDEVSVVSLDANSDGDYTDEDISDFASWLGGSFVTDVLKPLNGKLTVPLANGVELNLHMSKKVDREFTSSLVSLIHNIRRVIVLHQDSLDTKRSPAELLIGSFRGIKILQEQYGPEGVTQQGVDLLLAIVSKLFDSLQAAYQGEIVGVIFINGTPPPGSESMLNVMHTSRPSARLLAEKERSSQATAIIRVLLVRRALAWITGIILLVATLLGIYFLMNMPLTRDTLLYSNVKLD